MSSPHPDEPVEPQQQSDAEAQRTRSGNTAGILWVVVLVVLIAVGYWWFTQDNSGPTAPAIEAQVEVDEPVTPVTPDTPETPVTSVTRTPAATPTPSRPTTPVAAAPAREGDRGPIALASNPQPNYPARALRSGVEGSISVRIDVNAQGVPTDVQVVSRSGGRSRDLDRAVIDAARAWRFQPAIRDGEPVAGVVVVPVDFRRD